MALLDEEAPRTLNAIVETCMSCEGDGQWETTLWPRRTLRQVWC
jgi:hypothetical protein